MQIHPEVSDALAAGRPVVALESTIISHGLPRPDNLQIARRIEDAVRAGGAVPATIAIIGGEPHVGLDDAGLHRIATGSEAVKVSVRDLAVLSARGGDGGFGNAHYKTSTNRAPRRAHKGWPGPLSVAASSALARLHREQATTATARPQSAAQLSEGLDLALASRLARPCRGPSMLRRRLDDTSLPPPLLVKTILLRQLRSVHVQPLLVTTTRMRVRRPQQKLLAPMQQSWRRSNTSVV